jgi:hypothetical protein
MSDPEGGCGAIESSCRGDEVGVEAVSAALLTLV